MKTHAVAKSRKNDSFDRFPFEAPKLDSDFGPYAQFIFARIAFSPGTSCGVLKSRRFYPKGELSPIWVRAHAEGQSTLGVNLVQPETHLTKAAYVSLPGASPTESIGQACRLLSALEQEGIAGAMEVCPDHRTRVWAFFTEPILVPEAHKAIRLAGKRAFVSNASDVFPLGPEDEGMVELPPYFDSASGNWSVVLTLAQGESYLERGEIPVGKINWATLSRNRLGDATAEKDLVDFLEKTYEEGWGKDEEKEKKEDAEGYTSAKEALAHAFDSTPKEAERFETEAHPARATTAPLSDAAPAVIGRLLDPEPLCVPTPSEVLNTVLNGGWSTQRLYLLAGPAGEGKTTFCSWAAEYAAAFKIPVLFVSYQVPREQMVLYALAREGRIDSSEIERRGWLEGDAAGESDITKRLIDAGRQYFRTGDFFHVMEAEVDTTLGEIEIALEAVRERTQTKPTQPALVIIDSVRDLCCVGAEQRGDSTARIASAAMEIKRWARKNRVAALATLDVPTAQLSRGAWNLHAHLELDADYRAAAPFADTTFLLESATTRLATPAVESGSLYGEEHRLLDAFDHLLDERGHDPQLAKAIQALRTQYPLDPEASAAYARLAILKNRGGGTATHPVFRYDRAYHAYEPLPLDNARLDETKEEEPLARAATG